MRLVLAVVLAVSTVLAVGPTPGAAPAAAQSRTADARALLTALPVRAEAPVAAVRGFGASGGRCDLRSRALRTHGADVRRDGCRVLAGSWRSPWASGVVTAASDLAVLHVVTAREALRSGAAAWGAERRIAFANDVASGAVVPVPRALAVERAGAPPSRWLPATGRCEYAGRWIAVKTRWGLAVDQAERAALSAALQGCAAASAAVAAPKVISSRRFLPIGDVGPWKQLIAQDFRTDAPVGSFGARYPGWSAYDTGRDSSKTLGRAETHQGVYANDRTVSVRDGRLTCDLRTEGLRPLLCAITPALQDAQRHGQQYGRYVVRFRTERIPGYKIAWLLWPADDDWRKGEIDFPEAELDANIWAATHRTDGDPSQNAAIFDTGRTPTSWHTAAIEWTPDRIVFDLDGRRWTSTAANGLPQTPMMWALQAESRLSAAAPDPTVRGTITIDWLTAYAYRP